MDAGKGSFCNTSVLLGRGRAVRSMLTFPWSSLFLFNFISSIRSSNTCYWEEKVSLSWQYIYFTLLRAAPLHRHSFCIFLIKTAKGQHCRGVLPVPKDPYCLGARDGI